jgi:hypothetical protein
MQEGHDADRYWVNAVLAGVFNRLGNGQAQPLRYAAPAWLTQKKVTNAKEEIALARDMFTAFVASKQG